MAARRYMNINVLRYYLPVWLTLTQILRKFLLFEREEIYTFQKMLQVTPTAILLLLSGWARAQFRFFKNYLRILASIQETFMKKRNYALAFHSISGERGKGTKFSVLVVLMVYQAVRTWDVWSPISMGTVPSVIAFHDRYIWDVFYNPNHMILSPNLASQNTCNNVPILNSIVPNAYKTGAGGMFVFNYSSKNSPSKIVLSTNSPLKE